MSNETEEQKQTEILEHPEEKERRLTPESEKVIRDYVFKCLTPTGIVLLVISFVVGFFIHSVAFQSASNQAVMSAQTQILNLIREVMTAKFEVDNAVKNAQVSSQEISKTEEKTKKFDAELSSLQAKLDSTLAYLISDNQLRKIADVLAGDPRIANILNDQDKFLRIQIKKQDKEIDKIKLAYKIDSKRVEVNFNTSRGIRHTPVSFPFTVKHAWIEMEHITPGYYLVITGIEDSAVSVQTRFSLDIKAGPGQHECAFRVWATSF